MNKLEVTFMGELKRSMSPGRLLKTWDEMRDEEAQNLQVKLSDSKPIFGKGGVSFENK